MKPVKILYAEDDESLAFLTKDNLEQNHYEVTHFADGISCLEAFKKDTYDICILDIMLPRMDGFELTTSMRKMNPDIPIVFLSSKTLKEDRIRGLRLGADDYLIKPFSIEELLLKISIFLNRPKKLPGKNTIAFQVGKFTFKADTFNLISGEGKIVLTEREADLLLMFLENKEKVLRREYILKELWGDDDYFRGRSLDVFISRLRKILSAEKSISIQNIHSVGFKYSEKESS